MKIVKPPERVEYIYSQIVKVFLAGSIEMGEAENWQDKLIKEFTIMSKKVCFFNPRRDDWDSSWKQEINSANFYEQVTWELDHLDDSDIIALYFDPNTKSPISLLELGLYADTDKIIVCCPDEFWRKGNVDIVCQRYNIPVFNNYDAWVVGLKNKIRQL